MKHVIALAMVIAFTSCSVLRKHKTSDHKTTDSTHTQVAQFVEYHKQDSTGAITGFDSSGKLVVDTWQANTHIIELFDTTGKITKRTTHIQSTGNATTHESQVKGQTQQSDLHRVDSIGKKEVTTTHLQQDQKTNQVIKKRTTFLPWWLWVLVAVAVVVWVEFNGGFSNVWAFILALLKRKKSKSDETNLGNN